MFPGVQLLTGESVVVERWQETGRDPGNAPIKEWVKETVHNVLVDIGPRADVVDSNRPDGKRIRWTVHMPKGYPANLAGARISVRGQEARPVVGDPQHMTEANTPGPWSMPVELEDVEG